MKPNQLATHTQAKERFYAVKELIDSGYGNITECCYKIGISTNAFRKARGRYLPDYYPSTLERIAQNNNHDPEEIRHGWLKTDNGSVFLKKRENDLTKEDIDEIVKEAIKTIKPFKLPKVKSKDFAYRVITSDKHIGMNVKGDSNVFNYKYNKDIYIKEMEALTQNVLNLEKGADILFMVDLGDALDGYNTQTTRGGHHLPQNLNNREQFETYVDTQIDYYLNICKSKIAKQYKVICICNDNHDGDFGYMANRAVQLAVEKYCPEVEFDLVTDIFGYSEYGDHYFITTHGKDSKDMKGNWPLNLNPVTENKIRDIIDSKNIKQKQIHVEKGDLHQASFNHTGKFTYRNFMAFSPPSGWCQANFGSSYSGYSIQKVEKHGNLHHTDYFINYV